MENATDRTLGDVIRVFPKSIYDNPTWKGVAWIARDALIYAAIVWALVAVDSLWLLIPLWLLAGLAISGLFVLGHDAAHGSLFQSKKLSYWLGQACMLPSFHVYEAWVFGHNRIHHGHTTREVMDYVWHPVTPDDWAQLSPFQKRLHKLKWSFLGGGLYYMHDIWWKSMMLFTPPEKIAADVNRDRAIVIGWAALSSAAVLALGAATYGSFGGALWMWVKVLGVPFVVWNYCIGIAVYVHHIAPDIEWKKRRDWDRFQGQMEGTTILHVPGWINFFMHNIFLHVPHHVDMRIPFYNLPEASEAIREHFGDVVREREYGLGDYLATTRNCKLFDFETGRWSGYPREAELTAQSSAASS